jgi:ribose-phosphate pyrophosphokinase
MCSIPVGKLGIIAMPGCEELGDKINNYLINWRNERVHHVSSNINFAGYYRDTFLLNYSCIRFGTGEGKAVLNESVRGIDLYILCDCFNHGVTYKMYGEDVKMSPDEHFQDLKRIIAATAGKARRVSVIMPMLYEGRQHKRSSRESLDCANALQELYNLGVENIITFDAHDARVQNAIPLGGFESVQPSYQLVKALVKYVPDIVFDSDKTMIISPDEGGMNRCMYLSSMLELELGMFYKRRDYTKIVNGRNPIVAHEYLGADVAGKDVIIIDDMISSGDSVIDIGKKLKELNAKRIFICTTFGLFCEGLERFDEAYNNGYFEKVFTTNLVYRIPALLKKEWYCEVDVSKYIAYMVDKLNHDDSVSGLLNPADKIKALLAKHSNKQ